MNKTTGNKVKCTAAVMQKCKYGKCIASSVRYHFCDYLSKKHERRGCSPKECDKYEPKKK